MVGTGKGWKHAEGTRGVQKYLAITRRKQLDTV